MGSTFVAVLLAAGVGTWTFTKLQQRTGYGNGTAALKGAALAAVITFVVAFTVSMTIL